MRGARRRLGRRLAGVGDGASTLDATSLMRTERIRRPSTSSTVNRQPSWIDRLADLGDVLERAEHEPADGVPVLVGQLEVEQLVELVDRRAAVDEVVAVGQPLRRSASSTSYSSTISPTSSSRQSSSVISPAMPPYSSATMARWNLPACISRISRLTGLFSGMKRTGRARSSAGVVAATLALGADQVLGVGEADDVVAVVRRAPAAG